MTVLDDQAAAILARVTSSDGQQFGDFFLLRLLGMSVSYEDGACIVSFEAGPPLFNPQGTLHGGVLATAMDISMGHLLNHSGGPGATLEMKVQYFAAIPAGPVRVEGRFLRPGRSIAFLQSQAFRADGELAAMATATWRPVRPA